MPSVSTLLYTDGCYRKASITIIGPLVLNTVRVISRQGFNDWGGRGYDDFVPGEVTKTAPSRDRIT